MRHVLGLLVAAVLVLAAPAAEAARLALVIGNARYQHASPLANPVNDARDVAAKLRTMGYDVFEGYDLGKRAMEEKIGRFASRLDGAEAGVLYFAGHGIAVNGQSFILPVDARLDLPAALPLEAIPADQLVSMLSDSVRNGILFFDACRNNPFAKSLNRNSPHRGAQAYEGLSWVGAANGTFVAFSTKPGFMALDGTGRNSPFAEALMTHMASPGLPVGEMMRRVRKVVLARTGDFQRPQWEDDLLDPFTLMPAGLPLVKPPPDMMEADPSAPPGLPEDIEEFITGDYLKPDPADVEGSVRHIFAAEVSSFGSIFDREKLVGLRTRWLRSFTGWELVMVPGSLTVTRNGTSGVMAGFDLDYRFWRSGRMEPSRGRTRMTLRLERDAGHWRILSEDSDTNVPPN
jgi:hypothetical protein